MSLIEDPAGKRKPYDLKVHSPLTHAPYVHIEVSAEEFLQVPEHIVGEVETDDYKLTITTGLDDQLRTIVDRLIVERKEHAPAINGDVLNRLGCGDVLKHMVERGSFKWRRDPDNPQKATLVDAGPPIKSAPQRAFRSFRRPPTTEVDDQARQVADAIREARAQGIRAERAYAAEKVGLSVRTTTRRIDLARQRGYLEN